MMNKNTFFNQTFAVFKQCKVPRREPDYISYTKDGEVSSRYWYMRTKVIRESNHWSNNECNNIKTCYWILKDNGLTACVGTRAGSCKWSDFKKRPNQQL